MSSSDDYKLLDLGIGFTDIIKRPTRGSSDLSRKEISDGKQALLEKLCKFKPKIAVFNGKAIYEVYSGQKKFFFGRQPETLFDGATWVWVMPSSSARLAQLPRAIDKMPFFEALKKFRDHLAGKLEKLEDSEVVFEKLVLKNWSSKKNVCNEKSEIKTEFKLETKEDIKFMQNLNNVLLRQSNQSTPVVHSNFQYGNVDNTNFQTATTSSAYPQNVVQNMTYLYPNPNTPHSTHGWSSDCPTWPITNQNQNFDGQ